MSGVARNPAAIAPALTASSCCCGAVEWRATRAQPRRHREQDADRVTVDAGSHRTPRAPTLLDAVLPVVVLIGLIALTIQGVALYALVEWAEHLAIPRRSTAAAAALRSVTG